MRCRSAVLALVLILLSIGMVTSQELDLVGKSLPDAQEILKKRKREHIVIWVPSKEHPNRVISQEPRGEKSSQGKIRLYVARAADLVEMQEESPNTWVVQLCEARKSMNTGVLYEL